jgi:CxxC-x17-CxxC domain-containing protein
MEGRRFGNRPSFGGPREMHKATCSDCGVETEVPFKPIEGRPVYCRDCYQKHKNDRRPNFRDRAPREEGSSDSDSEEEQ